MKKPITKAVVYTRYSPRRKKVDECASCEVQEGICRQYADAKGWDVATVYHDEDVSGKDEYRPKLWQAIEALNDETVLLVYKRDRLARNVFLAEQINRAVKKTGGRIEAVSGDVDGDGPEQVMIRQVLASIAEYERQIIALRTSHAMKEHQRRGRRMGRYPPYGWRFDPETLGEERGVRLEPLPKEQETLELIRELRNEDLSPAEIARALNQAVPEAARSGTWHIKTVQKILARL